MRRLNGNSFLKFTFGLFCFLVMSTGQAAVSSLPTYKTDVVILGGGTAGLTSAIYLGRAGFSPLVLEGSSPGGAITQSDKVQNFPGFEDITGFDLADRIKNQAEKNGAILSTEEVIDIDLSERPFIITAQNVYDKSKQRKISANACIVALGATANKLGTPGEEKYWSKGVYSCAICDGSLYRDKIVAVVGGGDAAILEADYLAGIAKKVYILIRKDKFKGVEKKRAEQLLSRGNVEVIYNVQVKEIEGNEHHVEAVRLVDSFKKETSLPLDAVFLAIGSTPNTKAFGKQIELDSQGYIVLKKECESSVPGVFVAGDVADPIYKQAVIAGGEGAKAAMKAQIYLASLKETPKVPLAQVIEVKSLAHLKEIVAHSKVPVLVDFYATWCGPCRYLGPFMDTWAKDLQGKAVICKVNVDQVQDVALRYKVNSMPTVVSISSEGSELERNVGVDRIVQYIDRLKK